MADGWMAERIVGASLAIIGELIAELLLELVFAALSATIGVAIAGAAYALWLWTRRRVWQLTEPTVVWTPSGERFDVAVDGWRLTMPASERALGVRHRRRRGALDPGEWSRDDRLHPERQLESADGCLIVVAPFVLLLIVLIAVLALLELIVVGLVIGAIAGARLLFRRTWAVTVRSGSDGWRHRVDGLRAAREHHRSLVDEIGTGRVERARSGERID